MINNLVINQMIKQAHNIKDNISATPEDSRNRKVLLDFINKLSTEVVKITDKQVRLVELSKFSDKLFKLCRTTNQLYNELPYLIDMNNILSSQDKRLLKIYLHRKVNKEFETRYNLGGNY